MLRAAVRVLRSDDCALRSCALPRLARNVGMAMASRMAMMPTTTMSSMRVNPSSAARRRGGQIGCIVGLPGSRCDRSTTSGIDEKGMAPERMPSLPVFTRNGFGAAPAVSAHDHPLAVYVWLVAADPEQLFVAVVDAGVV